MEQERPIAAGGGSGMMQLDIPRKIRLQPDVIRAPLLDELLEHELAVQAADPLRCRQPVAIPITGRSDQLAKLVETRHLRSDEPHVGCADACQAPIERM